MTIDDLRKFFKLKTDSALVPKLKVTKGTISKWRKTGIPEEIQAVIQIRTGGKLKANIPADLKQQKETS